MNLPSFNTSLMPARPLVDSPPVNPAESCRAAHLFDEILQPAPCHAALQPAFGLIPTRLAHSPGLNKAQMGSLSYGSFQAGTMSSCSSSSMNGRGSSPARRSQAVGGTTPRNLGAPDCITAWGGGSILSSGVSNPLARGNPILQNPPSAQPAGALGGRGCSPSRGFQGSAPAATVGRGCSPGRSLQPPTTSCNTGAPSRGCSPSKDRQPPSQAATCSSYTNSVRAGNPARSVRSPNSPAPSPFLPPGSNSSASARNTSPARMPHPPCQPSGSNSRPCSPAVRMRARSPGPPGRLISPMGAASPPSMGSSNARFHSPGRSKHAPGPGPVSGAVRPLNLQAVHEPAAVGAGANRTSRGQQQEGTLPSRQLAQGARTGARLSDAMGSETASLQLGPAMQMPAGQPVEQSSDQQQCPREKMQRLGTMITPLDDSEQYLSLESAESPRTAVSMIVSQPAADKAGGAVGEGQSRSSRGSRGSSGHSTLCLAPAVSGEPASKAGGPADGNSAAAGVPVAALAGPPTPTPRLAAPGDGVDAQGQQLQQLAAAAELQEMQLVTDESSQQVLAAA